MDGKLTVLVLLIVVTDPYRGINYSKINCYDVTPDYLEDVIHVQESGERPESPREEYEETINEVDSSDVFIPWREFLR